jgi:ubiquinone/menaquinone biosynthesis C-methylase UbiE
MNKEIKDDDGKVDPKVEAWNKFSHTYYNTINRCSIPMMGVLMGLSRTNKRTNIFDAGCGPGLGTKLITSDLPNENSCVYALDFSSEMITYCSEVFREYDDFNANPRNHWEIIKEHPQEKINIERDLVNIRNSGKNGKIIKFLQGNIESLIFENQQFDVYISNYCLMLTNEVDQSIKEACRVLKNDGIAAFSIWGRKEESKLGFCTFQKVFKEFGIEIKDDKSSFWLSEDTKALEERFLNAGFKEVRTEYSTMIYDCYDEIDFLIKFQAPKVNSILNGLNDEKKVKEILEAVKVEAKKEVVEKRQFPTLDTMIIIALK